MIVLAFDPNEHLPLAAWRFLVKRAAGFACERCDSADALHSHHKNRDKTDCRLANGECLCQTCHAEEHLTERQIISGRRIAEWNRHNSPRRGVPLTEEHKQKVRDAAALRTPDHYQRALATKRASVESTPAKISEKAARTKRERGLDLSEITRRGWETRRRNASA